MNMPSLFQNAGVPASTEDLAKSLGQLATNTDGGSAFNGRELLKMDKNDGYWLYGQDGIEVEDEDQIAINPASFQHGFICWGDAKVLGEAMVPISQALPDRSALPQTGEKWDEQLMFDAQITNGDGEGVMLVYKTTAHGGKEAIRSLARMIVANMQNNPNHPVPAVKLSHTSYDHKKFGKIFKPVFTVTDWLDFDGNSVNKKITKTAAKQAAKKAEPKQDLVDEVLEEAAAEQAQEEPKPTSRRRRRAS